jgi:hypothetical protein
MVIDEEAVTSSNDGNHMNNHSDNIIFPPSSKNNNTTNNTIKLANAYQPCVIAETSIKVGQRNAMCLSRGYCCQLHTRITRKPMKIVVFALIQWLIEANTRCLSDNSGVGRQWQQQQQQQQQQRRERNLQRKPLCYHCVSQELSILSLSLSLCLPLSLCLCLFLSLSLSVSLPLSCSTEPFRCSWKCRHQSIVESQESTYHP